MIRLCVAALLIVGCAETPAPSREPTQRSTGGPTIGPPNVDLPITDAASVPEPVVVTAAQAQDAGSDGGRRATYLCTKNHCRVEHADDAELAKIAARSEITALALLAVDARSLKALAPMTWLRSISISMCNGLTDADLSALRDMTELSSIELMACPSIVSLAPLGTRKKLTSLKLLHMNIASLDPVRAEPITTLHVQESATNLSAVSAMTGITTLDLIDLETLVDPSFIKPLTELLFLDINNTGFTKLDVSANKQLQRLTIASCPKLTDLRGLSSLSELDALSLDNVPIADLGAMGVGSKVGSLNLVGIKARDLSPLARWKSLTSVIVSNDFPKASIAALKAMRPTMRVWTQKQANDAHF